MSFRKTWEPNVPTFEFGHRLKNIAPQKCYFFVFFKVRIVSFETKRFETCSKHLKIELHALRRIVKLKLVALPCRFIEQLSFDTLMIDDMSSVAANKPTYVLYIRISSCHVFRSRCDKASSLS